MGGDYVPVYPGAHPDRGRAPRNAGLTRLCPDVGADIGDRSVEAGAEENAGTAAEAGAGVAGASARGRTDTIPGPGRGSGATDTTATRQTRNPARPRSSPRGVLHVQASVRCRQDLGALSQRAQLPVEHAAGPAVHR